MRQRPSDANKTFTKFFRCANLQWPNRANRNYEKNVRLRSEREKIEIGYRSVCMCSSCTWKRWKAACWKIDLCNEKTPPRSGRQKCVICAMETFPKQLEQNDIVGRWYFVEVGCPMSFSDRKLQRAFANRDRFALCGNYPIHASEWSKTLCNFETYK